MEETLVKFQHFFETDTRIKKKCIIWHHQTI